jgi:hypothetical protein
MPAKRTQSEVAAAAEGAASNPETSVGQAALHADKKHKQGQTESTSAAEPAAEAEEDPVRATYMLARAEGGARVGGQFQALIPELRAEGKA